MRYLLPAMAVALFSSSSAWGACPAPLDVLRADAADAIELYRAFDFDAFRQQAALVHEEVECVTLPLTPDDAATVHTVRALDAWLVRDNTGVQAAVRGLYAADPGFELDLELAPDVSSLRGLFVSAKALGPGGELPVDDRLTVDGFPNQYQVPTQRAAVVQRIADTGIRTWYLTGGNVPVSVRSATAAPSPAATAQVTDTVAGRSAPAAPSRRGPRTSRTLLISGASAMALGAAGLSVAAITQSNFDALGDPSAESHAEAESLRNTNRITGIGGYASAAAGAGLVLSAVFVGAW